MKASRFDIETVVSALRQVVPESAGLHEPEFAGNEWDYVKECLDTGWVSSAGKFVDRFEAELAAYTGAARAAATVSGTAALHACLVLAGVGRDDEVLVPALTFVSPVNATAYCGAVPHFADADYRNFGLDVAKLDAHLSAIAEVRDGTCVNTETGRPIRAAVAVHVFGHPVDLGPLAELCEKFAITLIEDCAESLGSEYRGRHTGNVGRLAAFSFNGNKIVTGGGGAVLTNDPALGDAAKHLTTTAKRPHRWDYDHDQTGFNYRLPNLNAALGCAQMERLPDFLARKRRLADMYRDALENVPGVEFFTEPDFGRSNYWLNCLVLEQDCADQLEDLLARTNDAGIMTRPIWKPMHELPMYRDCPRMDLSTVEDLHRRSINLPSSPILAGS